MKRWPAEAASNHTWTQLDPTKRACHVGEAAWRTRNSDAVSAAKVGWLLAGWPVLFVLGALPVTGAYLHVFADIGVWYALVVELLLFALQRYYLLSHWLRTRNMEWSALLLAYLPDSLYVWAKKKLRGAAGGKGAAAGGAAATAAASPGGDGGAATAPSVAPHCDSHTPLFQPVNPVQPAAYSNVAPMQLWGGGGGGGAGQWGGSPAFGSSPRNPYQSPSLDVCRPLAYGSPQSAGSYNDAYGTGGGHSGGSGFTFRASATAHDVVPAPLAQLAEESFRAIMRLTGREGTSLNAASSHLQRDVLNHLLVLDKQLNEVQKVVKEMRQLRNTKLDQFSCVNSLQETLEAPVNQAPQPAAPAAGGFGGFGGGFAGFAPAQQKPPEQEKTKEQGLRDVIFHLQSAEAEGPRLDAHEWGGDRPGKGDRLRMKQILHRRLRLERVLSVERNVTALHCAGEYDTQSARMKQGRGHRQKFMMRLKALASEGLHEGRRDCAADSELILHVVAALLDSSYFGGRRSIAVEWSGSGGVLRYEHNRCPGLLQLHVEATTYQGQAIFVLRHRDRDLGIDTTYYTNPERSLYEAVYFFLLIFESKHPEKHHRSSGADQPSYHKSSLSRFAVLSRQFWEDSDV